MVHFFFFLQFTLSLSLAAALVMEKGQWSLKKEEDAPTK